MPGADLVPGLNYTLPFWTTSPVARALEDISIYVGQVGGPAFRALRIRDGIDSIANLYVQTNGTATVEQIATLMDSTPSQVELLPKFLVGEQEVKRLILWASVHWDTVNDFSPNGVILTLIVVFTIITIITTGVRMYSRWVGPMGIGDVDYIFGLGFVVTIVMAGIFANAVMMLAIQGSGAIWNVTYDQYIRTQVNSFLLTTLYHAAVGLIKCPIFLFYYHITTYKYQRVVLMFLLFCCAATNLVGFFFNIFKFQPVDIWNHQLEDAGSAYNTRVQVYRNLVIWVVGVANIVLDCLIWALPIPTLLKQGKSWKAKSLAIATVASGALPSIFSALRAEAIATGNINSQNGSLSEWQVNVYSLIEIHIMIWCFNIPAIRSLFVYLASKRRHQRETWGRTRVGSDNSLSKYRSEKNENTFMSHSSLV